MTGIKEKKTAHTEAICDIRGILAGKEKRCNAFSLSL